MKSEKEIIESIAAGDEQAFVFLYELYSVKIYNTSLSYAKNIEDAEEITQDVFLKIHKSAASFQGASSISTWIYRITVNAALNYIKKKKRFAFFNNSHNKDQFVNFEHPGVLLQNKENAQALYQALDCLPINQKTAFILCYIEELPRQEVADIMETSLKAVESLLQRAKSNMRSELEKTYPDRRKSGK